MGFCTDDEVRGVLPLGARVRAHAGALGHQAASSTGSRSPTKSSTCAFSSRIHDPLKQWKLSPMDLESRRRWEDYTKAKEVMLERTHIPEAPWWVVQAVDKKRARLNCIDAPAAASCPYHEVEHRADRAAAARAQRRLRAPAGAAAICSCPRCTDRTEEVAAGRLPRDSVTSAVTGRRNHARHEHSRPAARSPGRSPAHTLRRGAAARRRVERSVAIVRGALGAQRARRGRGAAPALPGVRRRDGCAPDPDARRAAAARRGSLRRALRAPAWCAPACRAPATVARGHLPRADAGRGTARRRSVRRRRVRPDADRHLAATDAGVRPLLHRPGVSPGHGGDAAVEQHRVVHAAQRLALGHRLRQRADARRRPCRCEPVAWAVRDAPGCTRVARDAAARAAGGSTAAGPEGRSAAAGQRLLALRCAAARAAGLEPRVRHCRSAVADRPEHDARSRPATTSRATEVSPPPPSRCLNSSARSCAYQRANRRSACRF